MVVSLVLFAKYLRSEWYSAVLIFFCPSVLTFIWVVPSILSPINLYNYFVDRASVRVLVLIMCCIHSQWIRGLSIEPFYILYLTGSFLESVEKGDDQVCCLWWFCIRQPNVQLRILVLRLCSYVRKQLMDHYIFKSALSYFRFP